MSDEPKKRSWAWIWWTAIAVLFVYPLSAFPACLIATWSVELGLVRYEHATNAINTFYAPVQWTEEKVPAIRYVAEAGARAIEPLAPHGKWW